MNDFFGGVFDFNQDGHTDCFEAALGMMILDDMEKAAQKKNGNLTMEEQFELED